MNFLTYPNQRIITVHRSRADKYYLKISNDCLADMFRDLSPSEFTVMIYLLDKIPNAEYPLSPKEISNAIRLSERTIREKTIRSLIKKGYITKVKGNRYRVTDYSTNRNTDDCNADIA